MPDRRTLSSSLLIHLARRLSIDVIGTVAASNSFHFFSFIFFFVANRD
jgi:hypothetical protein